MSKQEHQKDTTKDKEDNKSLVKMREAYFGKERAEKYRKDPDDVMTGILLDIIDYGYERAMDDYYGNNYHGSIESLTVHDTAESKESKE